MEQTILTPTQKSILSYLSKDKVFHKYFYFTGGTVLAEYYLHHRLSEDLDFFSFSDIDKIWLTSVAEQLKRQLGATKMDIQDSFNRNLVYFTIGRDSVKTEFTYFPFEHIENPSIKDDIKIDSFIDIAVNKFFTIYQKPSARHFIDLFLMLNTGKVKWEDLIKFVRIKFDTNIDLLQLGAQLMTVDQMIDLPRMIISLHKNEWQEYFFAKAKSLESQLKK